MNRTYKVFMLKSICFKNLFCLLLCCFFCSKIAAQTTKDNSKDLELWTKFNIEYQLKGGSFLFAETNLRYSTSPFSKNIHILPVVRLQQMVGYDQYLDKNWSVGLSLRYVWEKPVSRVFSRVYASHLSIVKGYEIQKGISFERIDSENKFLDTESRVSLFLGLSKNFNLKGKTKLRPTISYQVFMNHKWVLSQNPIYSTRSIDMGRLSIELAYLFNPKWSISLYFIDQTEYFWVLANFDSMGNQIDPDQNLNTTTPIIGCRLYCRLLNSKVSDKIRTRFLPF